jgi:putative transposase
MQVRGLPGHVVRSDAVRRWRSAMAAGLTGEAAAKAVGEPRATLYRWEAQPKQRSRAVACFARVC